MDDEFLEAYTEGIVITCFDGLLRLFPSGYPPTLLIIQKSEWFQHTIVTFF
jgi:hypothetical protein